MNKATGCPDNYDELFRTYFPMMRAIIYKSGIAAEDVQDVAMDILAKFIEKDGIAYYDPHRLHDTGDNPEVAGDRYRKAKFSSMLRGFTATYVMAHRDKQMTRHRREPFRLEMSLAAHPEDGDMTWADSEFYAEDSLDSVETSVVVISAFHRSRKILVERSTPKRDYEKFCGLVWEMLILDGKVDRKRICAELDISTSTVGQMWNDFKEVFGSLVEGAA